MEGLYRRDVSNNMICGGQTMMRGLSNGSFFHNSCWTAGCAFVSLLYCFGLSNLDGRRLQEGDLILPCELQETRKLLGKIHDLLHRHDGQLGEVGKPLLAYLSVLQVLTLRPRLAEANTGMRAGWALAWGTSRHRGDTNRHFWPVEERPLVALLLHGHQLLDHLLLLWIQRGHFLRRGGGHLRGRAGRFLVLLLLHLLQPDLLLREHAYRSQEGCIWQVQQPFPPHPHRLPRRGDSQCSSMPASRHLRSRHCWHLRRMYMSISQWPLFLQEYCALLMTLRRKKPLQPSQLSTL